MPAHCSTCSCPSEEIPQPSTSSPGIRRLALEAAAAAVRASKEKDKKPAGATCTRCGETSASFCEDWDCHEGWSKP